MSKPSEQIVLQCRDCPMFSPSDVQETCRHPDGGLRRIDYDEMDEIPQWCPLRSGPLTISIPEEVS